MTDLARRPSMLARSSGDQDDTGQACHGLGMAATHDAAAKAGARPAIRQLWR